MPGFLREAVPTTRLRNSLKYAPVKGISSFGVDQEYEDDDDVTASSLIIQSGGIYK